jgi:Pyridoxamine 5'-phosphate oxidase
MPSPNRTPLAGHKYLNLESFKRDGTPVQTPVWFAEDHGLLYVYTLANAGKVKRIRRNPRIRIAPCTMRGTLIGPWVDEEDGRPGQSHHAPGTGGYSDSVSRVTTCPDRRKRQWLKRSEVSALAILCPMSCRIREPFLIDCPANSPLPARRDVPTPKRMLRRIPRGFLIQHALHIKKPCSAPRAFLHRSSRRSLLLRRLLRGCDDRLFCLCGSRGFLEALAKRTDHTCHVLHYSPKHSRSFTWMVETPISLGPANVSYAILRARLCFQPLHERHDPCSACWLDNMEDVQENDHHERDT